MPVSLRLNLRSCMAGVAGNAESRFHGNLIAESAIGRRSALPVAVAGAVVLGLLRGSLAVAVPGPATLDGNLGTRQ